LLELLELLGKDVETGDVTLQRLSSLEKVILSVERRRKRGDLSLREGAEKKRVLQGRTIPTWNSDSPRPTTTKTIQAADELLDNRNR